jgi:hypothetical protein
MSLYIFIFHPIYDDAAACRIEVKFDDDLEALEAAEHYQINYEIDVWTGDRFVAQVKKGNAPLNVNDAHAG